MADVIHIEPQPGTLVRFISDLHYGHERCQAPAPEQLMADMDGVGMLVVAGDLAETRPCRWQQRGTELREQLRACCRSRNIELVELAGNHDPDTPALAASFWQGRVVAMHGHALYKEVAPWSWEYLRNREKCRALIASYPDCDTDLGQRLALSRAMSTYTPPILRREGIRNRHLRGFLHCFWPPQRPWGIVCSWLTCARRAARFMHSFFPKAQFLIFGHFHRSCNRTFGTLRILNTGAWFRHATPYAVDMQDGKFIAYRRLG